MNQAILVKRDFNTSVKAIWNALTNVNDMTQWFFENIPDFKAEVGFETQFVVKPNERSFTHLWKIIEVVPNEKIVYDWSYKEYPGKGLVSFIILKDHENPTLQIINEWVEPFPSEIPEFSEESCRGGWTYFINRLYKYLH